MKIAIVGSGALGLYYGALLQRGGHDVHFLLRSDYDAIMDRGLTVHSINGDFHLPFVSGHREPQAIGIMDLVMVGLKTFANNRLGELVSPLVGTDTRILTLQNGLGNEELLAERFGAERIIGGVAFLCSNRGEPGHVHHLAAGRVVLGEFRAQDRAFLERVVDLFKECGIDCRATADLKKARWEKLVWNIPFNGLSALLTQSVDRLLATPDCRELVRELMVEVITAANTQQLSAPIPEKYADTMLEFTDGMGVYKPSMQIDREEGRELELQAIFRAPLKAGRVQGVAMPRVGMLTVLLSQCTVLTSQPMDRALLKRGDLVNRQSPEELIRELGLLRHPEGGWYRETYRSNDVMERFWGVRACSTAIYFLLQHGEISAFHRIKSDEIWHFYAGATLTVHKILPDGGHQALHVGSDLSDGVSFQIVVPAGCWFGAEVAGAGDFSLVGCTVAPGFDFADFEMADREALLQQYPVHEELIRRLTYEKS